MKKPLIVGMNNPYSDDPYFALYPSPEKSAGFKLYMMLKEAGHREGFNVLKQNYVDTFDRMNVVNGQSYNRLEASKNKPKILDAMRHRLTVICGAGTARDLKLFYGGFTLEKNVVGPYSYYVIPHPSGLTREYNDPEMRFRVGELLLSLYKEHILW